MRHGYKGAFEIAATIDYMFAFAATQGRCAIIISRQPIRPILADEKVLRFLREKNPAAAFGNIGEAAGGDRPGLWNPRSNSGAIRTEQPFRPRGYRPPDGRKPNREDNHERTRPRIPGEPIAEKDEARTPMKMAKKKTAATRSWPPNGRKRFDHRPTPARQGQIRRGLRYDLRTSPTECPAPSFVHQGRHAHGERDLIEKHFGAICQFYTLGEGFTWETQDRGARSQWRQRRGRRQRSSSATNATPWCSSTRSHARCATTTSDAPQVVRFLKEEKPHMHACGPDRPQRKEDLIEIADLVTEMELVKHPFRSGIKGQKGVEF